MDESKEEKLNNLDFEKFRKLASDKTLSRYEKIGFYDSLRKEYEKKIFSDILHKLTRLGKKNLRVMDIGCGCSELPRMLIGHCRDRGHSLLLVDSKEMLDQLPEAPFIKKIPARFPVHFEKHFKEYVGKVDVILVYSVFHYVIKEAGKIDFMDRSLSLLSHGGQMLIGDIPSFSKRKRFFLSPAGIEFHQKNNKTKELPKIELKPAPDTRIDDALILTLLKRSRHEGFDSYLLPQPNALPMSNRREDLLFVKP